MITRRPDWRTRLQHWAQAQAGRPFIWGETDCASLARDALYTMFDQDPVPEIPQWRSPGGALRALKRIGSVGELLRSLGAEPLQVSFMRAGDVVVMEEPEESVGGEAVMVCIDNTSCIASTPNGVILVAAPDPKARAYSLWELAVG